MNILYVVGNIIVSILEFNSLFICAIWSSYSTSALFLIPLTKVCISFSSQ